MNIIELAKQAGLNHNICEFYGEELKAFAELVRADERERIEKAWDKLYGWWEADDETETRGTT